MKEFKNADELHKKLAELVAQDWKEVVSRPQSSNLLLAGGRSYRQPKRFHNLSHCSQVVTTSSCDSENTTKEEIELDVLIDKFSKHSPFRPLDMFDANFATLASLAGLAFTYVIVLLQFKIGES